MMIAFEKMIAYGRRCGKTQAVYSHMTGGRDLQTDYMNRLFENYKRRHTPRNEAKRDYNQQLEYKVWDDTDSGGLVRVYPVWIKQNRTKKTIIAKIIKGRE